MLTTRAVHKAAAKGTFKHLSSAEKTYANVPPLHLVQACSRVSENPVRRLTSQLKAKLLNF